MMGLATITVSIFTVMVCFSKSYNTQPIIGLCIAFLLLCVIGLFYKTKTIQHYRPLILLISLVWFGFIAAGCNCILFYFQGFILFLMGNTAFWLSFVVILSIITLSVVFGAIWCSWICWLGALQEFIYQKNKWRLFKSKKTQKILIFIQIFAFVALVLWIIVLQRPVLCSYDPFISIFRLKFFNRIGYISVPLLLISSLFIYRPFCRTLCPIGLLMYLVKYLPFAKQLKLNNCTGCKKCHSYCKLDAIEEKKVNPTCIMCGECKKSNCSAI